MELANNKPLITPLGIKQLPKGWRWSRLDDLCDGVFDNLHSTPTLVNEGPFYVVRTQDILTGIFRRDNAGRVTEQTYRERIARAEPSYGDLVYSREGTYFGIAAEVPLNVKVCLGQRMMLIKPKPDKVYFRYLRYWLNSPIMSSHVYGFRDGTVAERLNLPVVRGLPVLLPPPIEQRAIAHILGTLDNKIELNRKMNQTLEAMARALFKSWFVDFDPVRAKLEGRQPAGMDSETAALFPDLFEDTALGEMPRGWAVRPLEDAIDFLEGPGIRNWQYTNSEIGTRFINIRCIQNRDIQVTIANRVHEQEAYGKYKHFLLEANDIVVSTSGTLGRYAIVRKEHLPLMLNTSVIRMRPVSNVITWAYLLGYIESDEFQLEIETRASGSVQRNFGPIHLRQIKLLVPPLNILKKFSELADPIHHHFLQNLNENAALAALRDTLLPKLMSGEVRVREAEAEVEATA